MRRARYLADRLATQLLRQAGVLAKARVDLELVSSRLGAEVVQVAMEQDGRLVVAGDRATLFVNREQTRARQRFSAAHELAHWVLRSPSLQSKLVQETDEAFRSIETMCNTLAGALLMPYWWVKEEFPRAAEPTGIPSLALVRDVARYADVSLAAAAVRMRDVFGWRRTLLHWTFERGLWSFVGEAGLFPWEQGLVIPTARVDFQLTRARASSSSEVQIVYLPLIVGGYEDDYEADVIVHGDSAVALIELPPTKPPSAKVGYVASRQTTLDRAIA